MKDEQYEMQRWRDRPAGEATVEDRAADLIRRSAQPGEPDARRLLSIGRDILQPSPRRPQRPLSFRLALIGAALLAGVAAVKAYEMVRRATQPDVSPTAKAPAHASAARRRAPYASRAEGASGEPAANAEVVAAKVASEEPRHDRPVAAAPASETAPVAATSTTAAPSPAKTAPAARTTASFRASPRPLAAVASATSQERPSGLARASVRVPSEGAPPDLAPVPPRPVQVDVPPRASLPPPMPPPFAATVAAPVTATAPRPTPTAAPAQAPQPSAEVLALDRAIGLLRRDHDGAAALSALDAYLARYPRGLLNREARFARVDALLLLGRSDQALSSLETLPLDRGRRSTELQVIRAELRSSRNCAGAELDFSAALGQSPGAGLMERILYGRGVCRAKLGNASGARSDFERYLDRFPAGVHATSVAEWLKSNREQIHHAPKQ